MGFPIHRRRVVIIGIRAGCATIDGAVRNFNMLMASPMPPCLDWRGFVGRSSVPTLILNSVGDPLDESALGSYLSAMGCDCTCTIDPYCFCALHPCHCNHCKTHTSAAPAAGQSNKCEWRKTHTAYIQKHIGANVVADWVANSCKLKTYPWLKSKL